MDRMKNNSLTSRLMARFVVCMVILTVLAIPLFYHITTQYYAEDLADLIRDYGIENPDIDLEEDIMEGMFFQFLSILSILFVAVLLVMRYVSRRMWRPFYDTLEKVKGFRVDKGIVPKLTPSGVKEFDELNDTLTSIMDDCVRSYKVQREFTENASHELQTPIAVMQSRLDNLLQDGSLTERQAGELQQVYEEMRRVSRLCRNLLLLSKIENHQYGSTRKLNLCDKLVTMIPNFDSILGNIVMETCFADTGLVVDCNEALLESAVSNLVVNAIRHNTSGGNIRVVVSDGHLLVSNPSKEPPIDAHRVFSRFYRTKSQKGNGLGLAIVKSICDYHGWTISYRYEHGYHLFDILFAPSQH